ncbi:MAG: hypothetical protein K0S12_1632, partial [Bacteroidetes bacterium]|nr:hypothetical protein [Bacteroidota bacterium]
MKLIKCIVRSLLFFLPLVCNAQTYPFINYGVQEGLAQSNVSGIVQDKDGYLWIATESGVSKFDGKDFVNYTTENGLADNNVSCIFQDRSGIIWLGHENGMITKFNGKEFLAVQSDQLPKEEKIYSISQDKKGSLWLSTATSGAICILSPDKNLSDKTNYKRYAAKEGLSQYVFSSVQDKQGTLWFLTDVGIRCFNEQKGSFTIFNEQGMPPGQATALSLAKDGNILIGTSASAVSKYDVIKKTFEPVIVPSAAMRFMQGPPSFVYTIFEDTKGNVWASILNYGVCRHNKENGQLTFFNAANGLQVNKVKSISEDREGNILFGTLGEGIEIFKGEKFVSFSKKDGLVNNQVFAITQDKENNYWVGTNEGISIYNPAERSFKNISSIGPLQSNSVRALATDRQGNVWIGTWGGKVARYNVANTRFDIILTLNESIKPFVSCLLVDKNNKLWVGTGDGLASLDLENGSVQTYREINGLSDNDISCLFEDSKGTIWVGTRQKGITLINGSSFKIINKEDGLSYNSITSVAEDSKGKIWIGTEGGGVFVYNNSVFTNYKIRDGLPSDFITLITLDNNKNIWLGTNKGLCKYDEGKQQFRTYLKSDGFTAVETKSKAVFNDREGAIWFGTVDGVFKYDARLDPDNSFEPMTKITSVRVNGREVSAESALDLSYKENSVDFDFIGISLSNPEGVVYKVMLEGYDESWRITKDNSVSFSNLPSGEYVFRLTACNGSGLCNKDPLEVSFKITPPFWKTLWFYILVVTVGLALFVIYVKIRERSLIREKKILEEKVKERTAEVVQKNIELDEKNKDITASIRYAKRIQDAILPPDEFVKTFLPKTFVLFKPKDIVSGDFYWLADKKDMVLFAAVDCTGHGVPGAF